MPTQKTEVDICNLALSVINQSLIVSMGEQSQNARLANLWYDQMRQEVLRACDWTFARTTQLLALIGQLTATANFPDWANPNANPTNPTGGSDADLTSLNALQPYAFLYRYPSHCLYVKKVYNPHFPAFPGAIFDPFYKSDERGIMGDRSWDYKIVRSPVTNELALASNLDDARVDFVQDMTDVSQFDPLFVRALAYAIAKEIVMPLTGDKELAAQIEIKHKDAISNAQRINHAESPEYAPKSSSYERAREWG